MKLKRPRYVHTYRDNRGKLRHYLRKPGAKPVALPGPVFSLEFWTAYHAAMQADVKSISQQKTGKDAPGTMGALIAQYYASVAFTGLSPVTQDGYKRHLERFRAKHGHRSVAGLKALHVDAILGEEAARSKAQASNLRKRLFTLMTLAAKWGYRDDNPMLSASRVKYKAKGYRTWTDADIARYRDHWAAGTPQRIALEILLYTGLRRSDAVRLGRQHIVGGFIRITTKKSGHTVKLNIPVHDDFKSFLDTLPTDNLALIVTKYGIPRSEKGFTGWIIEAAREAGLPEHSSPHGVRKASCRMLAEAGCSALEIMAITGHKNLAEIELYCREAQQAKLAKNAIAKLKSGSD